MLGASRKTLDEDLRHADTLRDQVGKALVQLRTLNDAAEFEFGSDRQRYMDASHIIVRAAFSAAALFWNELAFLHSVDRDDVVRESRLIETRRALAADLNRIADAVGQEEAYEPGPLGSSNYLDGFKQSHYGEYVGNIGNARFKLTNIVSTLNAHRPTIRA